MLWKLLPNMNHKNIDFKYISSTNTCTQFSHCLQLLKLAKCFESHFLGISQATYVAEC